MERVILDNEPAIRLAVFFGVFAIMAGWELLAPRRDLTASKTRRWANNIAITALNTILVRLLVPILAVGAALYAAERGWGLFNLAGWSAWIAVPASVLLLDLLIYGQHVLFHKVPALWRIHRMHHADLDIDVTTGARFHPVEIFLSMAIKIAAVLALGAPAVAVVIFEVLLNATAMFNHSNVRLPAPLDAAIRLVVVTPDMHRVHHSVLRSETDSNYGFNLTWWDRLFATYRAQPEAGHEGMTIGLPEFREERRQDLLWMLALPFLRRGDRRAGMTRDQSL
ncbi:MAG: sterol desaturase family protein [Alphaproteobacteria bacterium]|nr:sterol desaturase family protein [Alphaproteobacteria bacterium]